MGWLVVVCRGRDMLLIVPSYEYESIPSFLEESTTVWSKRRISFREFWFSSPFTIGKNVIMIYHLWNIIRRWTSCKGVFFFFFLRIEQKNDDIVGEIAFLRIALCFFSFMAHIFFSTPKPSARIRKMAKMVPKSFFPSLLTASATSSATNMKLKPNKIRKDM